MNDGSQIQFFCDVTLGGHVVPDTVALQVDWLADDEIIQSETFGLLQQHKGQLKEDKWAIGQTLQCRAKAKHTTINTFTAPSISPPLNTGVLLLSPTVLLATEGSEPANIEFQTTIPIVCPKKEKKKEKKKTEKKEEEQPEEEEECCVTFEVSTKLASQSGPRCAGGNAFDLVVLSTCQYKVCADEWNTTHKLPVWAVNDGLFGGEDAQENPPSVIIEMRTAEASPPRWQDIILPVQEVTIQQAEVSEECIAGDYIQTFDGLKYKNTYEGTFVLYKHATFPYEVQIHRRKCSNLPLCNCGIAMRFGEIMLAADVCTTGKMRFWSYTLDGNYIEPAKLQHLPKIVRVDEGRSFQIQFPSGTRLNIGPNLRHISIQASLSDLEHTTGLCGSFDRDLTNDFSSYKGQVVCTPNLNVTSTCDDFTKSWRLLTEQSLFVGSFTNDGNDEDESHLEDIYSPGHCSCSGLKNEEEVVLRPVTKPFHSSPYEEYRPETEQTEEEAEAAKCTSSQCIDPRGEDITNQLIELLQDEDFTYEGEEFGIKTNEAPLQPIFVGQSSLQLALEPNGVITEDAAEVYCRGLIEGMSVTKLCRDIAQVDIESHISSCKNEVFHSKSTAWTMDALEHLRWNCRYQVYHNLSTWEPQLGRQHGTPPLSILSSLCLNNCSDAGTCDHGTCRCRTGFSGADCSVNTNLAPKITGLGFTDACDIRNRACSEVLVWGDKFAEHNNIKCHFDVYRSQSVKTVPSLSGSVNGNGRLLTYQSIVCDIPDMPIHDAKVANFYIPGEGLEKTRQLLRVRISYGYDGTKSEPIDYVIYDSLCWECTTALTCQPRPTQSCNVLSDPFGTNNDPFQNSPSFSNPSLGFAQSNSPLQYSPDSSSEFSPSTIPGVFNHPIPHNPQPTFGQFHPGLSNPCLLPKDSGPCKSDNLRYFFDSAAGKCRPFIFGGCHGNNNNFITEQDCLQSCSNHRPTKDFVDNTTVSVVPHLASPSFISLGHGQQRPQKIVSPSSFDVPRISEKCNLGSSTSSCPDEIVRYYYDSLMRKCRPFISCPGNTDNFPSKESCMRECELSI
ncbi:Kunitz-type protease inhibitor 2 [Orchesella cincta]|uniref:Kunitz-type protease inhibitor 2 n=1 Tax=Orchesella cincta TaxID=48709 RepID=A0A1D2NMW7_ORCCI|nr:Kunitz-type protease inhibitor 2 [Orchesella cincta]